MGAGVKVGRVVAVNVTVGVAAAKMGMFPVAPNTSTTPINKKMTSRAMTAGKGSEMARPAGAAGTGREGAAEPVGAGPAPAVGGVAGLSAGRMKAGRWGKSERRIRWGLDAGV